MRTTEAMRYCGIDVSCNTLDVCYQTSDGDLTHLKVTNDTKGFRQLVKATGDSWHFVMEATGVYHIALMFFLYEKQCSFSVVNALQIKRYIQMHLERNKTDKKDARRICEYGMERNPAPTIMPDRLYFECKSINNAIKKMTAEIICFNNQVHSLEKLPVCNKEVLKSYNKIVRELMQQKLTLETELTNKLMEWQPQLVKQVSSVVSIGKRATAELIIYTQGFKNMQNYRQLISYAGLSPREFSSGSRIRAKARICKQGGKVLRNVLYMCALNAIKTNSSCKQLYQRMVDAGKNKKLALIAVCNKLLKQVFGVIKNQTLFDNNYLKNSH